MKKHFITFMTNEGMTKGAKDSYCTYVNKAYELFSKPHILKTYPTIYDRMLDLTKRSRIKYCEYLISLLNVEIHSPLSGCNKDYLRKYKSGVTMLSRFVSSDTYPYNGSKQFNTKFSVSYSIDDLIDNFTFRIETQDRIYASKNCFPCRLLGRKIYASKSIYHKQYKDILNKTFYKTKFLVNDKRDYVTLEKIDALNILGGISIHTRSKEYDVYTDTFSGNQYTGCVKTKGKILEDLSLDHDRPLENIINSEIYKLPELKKLSDAIWEYHSKTGLTGTQLTTNFYDKVYVSLAIDEKRLLDEVAELYKHIELTIMDGRINSALNNKIIIAPPLGSDL